jgi:predicted O-linked N-acetylglucosamine transferase (SPINDLY family)
MPELTIQQALDLAIAHHGAGRAGEAEQICRQILTAAPHHAYAANLLGVIGLEAGHTDAAVDLLQRAISLDPNFPEAASNLGNALLQLGRIDQAIDAYQHAITLRPGYARARANLGNAFICKGQLDQAIDACREAIALDPNLPEGHNNLGNALLRSGQKAEAAAAYQNAVRLRPAYLEAWLNLGLALLETGRSDESIAAYRTAVAMQPKYGQTFGNPGKALKNRASSQRDAITSQPDFAVAYNNLGNALKDAGRLDEAIAAYRQAIAIDPQASWIESNLLYTLHFHPAYGPREIAGEHRPWNHRQAEPLRSEIRPHPNDRLPSRRIRIGYVSPDLRRHAVGHLLLPVFEQHDAASFEIICFSNVVVPDSTSSLFESHAHAWHSIVALSDAEAAELIRREKIDILVDLSLHMAENRLLIFARKPAPVQITWVGYPSTTGLSTIDYRISDPFLDPPGTDDCYVEQTIRLPHSSMCWRWSDAEEDIGSQPMLANGQVTFGSLNNFAKVTPAVLDVWARILLAVPNSRLLLLCPAGEPSSRVRGHFASFGISNDRILLSPRVSRAQYIELIRRMDISLDPFPYPGHTTSCDLYWMGVPTVTLAGQTAVSRLGASLLHNLGLPELIAANVAEYVSIAVSLAGDTTRLNQLRATLRQRMAASPVTDAAAFTRDLESIYRRAWEAWRDSPS